MWDNQPWDNDQAADWFAKLIGDSGFAARVRQTLQRISDADYIDDEQYLTRAACYSLLRFGYVYVWPIDELITDLKLGISVVKRVIEETDDDKMRELLGENLEQLESRLNAISQE